MAEMRNAKEIRKALSSRNAVGGRRRTEKGMRNGVTVRSEAPSAMGPKVMAVKATTQGPRLTPNSKRTQYPWSKADRSFYGGQNTKWNAYLDKSQVQGTLREMFEK